jgi:hypothetical protein
MSHCPPLSRDAWKPVHFSKASLCAIARIKPSSSSNPVAAYDSKQAKAIPVHHPEEQVSIKEKDRAKPSDEAPPNESQPVDAPLPPPPSLPTPLLPSTTTTVGKPKRGSGKKVPINEEDLKEDEFNHLFDIPAANASATSGSSSFADNGSANHESMDAHSNTETSGRSTRGIRKSYADLIRGHHYLKPYSTHTVTDNSNSSSVNPVEKLGNRRRDRDRNPAIVEEGEMPIGEEKGTSSLKQRLTARGGARSGNKGGSGPVFDEINYFGIYVNYYHKNVYSLTKNRRAVLTITDDACFLCKDGGVLVECDCVKPENKKIRCLKTYHEYCLGFTLKKDQDFTCMRHFCDVCGDVKPKYFCYYCPISICAVCPEERFDEVTHVLLFGSLNHFTSDPDV